MKTKKSAAAALLAAIMMLTACSSSNDAITSDLTDSEPAQTSTVYSSSADTKVTESTVGHQTESKSDLATESEPASNTESAAKTESTTKTEPAPTTVSTTKTEPAPAPVTEAQTQKPPVTTGSLKEPISASKMTTAQVVADMGIGINLGNTMEACGDWINSKDGVKAYETAWGSPVITKKMIQGYADSGFGVLRIPVAWSNMMDLSSYKINADYMARVKEITQWAIDSGMYVIVNIHWDGGWWEKFPEDKDECMKRYTRIWEQICEGFKNFDHKLMFESLNEEGGWDSMWNRYSNQGDKKGSYSLLNEINQKFVNIVRASGGNNATRHLLIAGYCTDIDLTCDSLFKMPNDPQNRCAVSVHYYTPATFCLLKEDVDWGKLQTTWGSNSDIKLLQKNMNKLKTTFVDKGIPVIIGEFSVCEKQVKETESVHRFITSVIKEATERGMCPVLWDVTNDYYDRTKCKFIDKELLKEMMAAKVS